eukprot:6319041-Amphidinium_carterae.1
MDLRSMSATYFAIWFQISPSISFLAADPSDAELGSGGYFCFSARGNHAWQQFDLPGNKVRQGWRARYDRVPHAG